MNAGKAAKHLQEVFSHSLTIRTTNWLKSDSIFSPCVCVYFCGFPVFFQSIALGYNLSVSSFHQPSLFLYSSQVSHQDCPKITVKQLTTFITRQKIKQKETDKFICLTHTKPSHFYKMSPHQQKIACTFWMSLRTQGRRL